MSERTKYKLKSEEELTELLSGRNGKGAAGKNPAVFACKKCFKLFTSLNGEEPEVDDFLRMAAEHDISVIHIDRLDFLCNEHRLKKHVAKLKVNRVNAKPDAVFIIACGIGMQTFTDLAYKQELGIPVYTACDSVEQSESQGEVKRWGSSVNQGLSLTDKLCDACGQCFLTKTSGICPITGCSKKLLNGPCGGSKDGYCEVDNKKECVWVKIHNAESNQKDQYGNIKVLPDIYNHNRIKRSETAELAQAIRNRRMESFYGGIYLKYSKEKTANLTIEKFPLPEKVIIPMSQHMGMPAIPIVSVGDYVFTGQKIGEADGALSSCVHASISGTVASIGHYKHQGSGKDDICITIISDGKDELHRSASPISYWEDLDIMDIEAIVAEKGIVGMGGAGFPTPVKLKAPKPIDTILLNGCESEPYITADHRVMLEYADTVISGLQLILKSTGAKRAIIVISDNKSDAVALMEMKTAHIDNIFVMSLWSKYPQGAERMLIARSLGRHLEYGQRPYDVGAIVINVSTARAIGEAFIKGMPLIERVVTVSGEGIMRPGNYKIRIGTPVTDILVYCGLKNDSQMNVILGGPMMGINADITGTPILKGTNAVIAIQKRLSRSNDCIRCGRCVDVCPMELLPLYFPLQTAGNTLQTNDENTQEKNAINCIECGACDYICPSGIKIRDAIRKCKYDTVTSHAVLQGICRGGETCQALTQISNRAKRD